MKRKTPLRRRSSGKARVPKTPRCTKRSCNSYEVGYGLCRKHMVQANDAMARELSLRIYGDRCARCGKEGPTDWSHHIGRAAMHLRWSMTNCTRHCRPCHMHLTYHHNEHAEHAAMLVGAENYAWLMDEAYGPMDEFTGRRLGPRPFKRADLVSWFEHLTEAMRA